MTVDRYTLSNVRAVKVFWLFWSFDFGVGLVQFDWITYLFSYLFIGIK